MSKERTYFVSYAHTSGFGNIEIFVTGRLVIDRLRENISNTNGLPIDSICVISFVELRPTKEIWSEERTSK